MMPTGVDREAPSAAVSSNSLAEPTAFLRALAELAKVPGWRLSAVELTRLGAKADASGAGRVPRVARAIQALPADEAAELIEALGEIVRPMTARELEKALMQTDLSCRHRKAVVTALRAVEIVAVAKR